MNGLKNHRSKNQETRTKNIEQNKFVLIRVIRVKNQETRIKNQD